MYYIHGEFISSRMILILMRGWLTGFPVNCGTLNNTEPLHGSGADFPLLKWVSVQRMDFPSLSEPARPALDLLNASQLPGKEELT